MDLRTKSVQMKIIHKASGQQRWSLGWGWERHIQEMGIKGVHDGERVGMISATRIDRKGSD